MGIVIDSDILIKMERSRIDFDSLNILNEEECFISVITASELLHGVYRAKDDEIRNRRLAFVETILVSIPTLEIDLHVSRVHSSLWASLVERGELIGMHDSWIAATAMVYGYKIFSGNRKHFERIPGLDLV